METQPRIKAPHAHVRLLAGTASNGKPAYEMVPAEPLGETRFRLLGTPALVLGCAAADLIDVQPDGRHRVAERGGNVAVVAYLEPDSRPAADLESLRALMTPLAGLVEAPADLRFVVVTVPVTATFAVIERAMADWTDRTPGVEWHFTNVYDDDGQPLGWWEQP